MPTSSLVKDRIYMIDARGVRSEKGEVLVQPVGAFTPVEGLPMMTGASRRDFLTWMAGRATLLCGASDSWALTVGDDREWAFPVLGDLHIDRPEHHDMAWLEKEKPADVSQVKNYARITREVTPKLLAAVRAQVKAARVPVPFAVQLGDLVEGLCGSEDLAAKQATDALDMVRRADLSVPFLFTKGNHDVAGPGAAKVYDQLLVPFLATQDRPDIKSAAYARERQGTLLVFYDAYNKGSLDWFAQVIADRKPRRLLFVIHPPVVPFNARSTWHVYSSSKQETERKRLLELLARAGGGTVRSSAQVQLPGPPDGERPFAQLAISSVGSTDGAKPRDLIENVKGYGPDLVKLEPKHSPETEQRRREVLEAERPFVERFEFADTWGHAMLSVHGDRVRSFPFQGAGGRALEDPRPHRRPG